ncbi:uncharacterized protein [Ptychodera flava]|uniref:uncharacterized protein isoform X2 n=1 Tax=Ptychodera flava TaxID=63121 RepID=UPI003969FB57
MPRSQLKPWKTENGDLPYTGENGYNQFDHLKHTRSNQYGDMIGSGNIDETDERMIFEGSQPLQIPFPSVNGPTSSVPYTLNLDMSMNNDLLDLSKPLKGYPLRKGVSNISLDSLNDNYIDSNDTLRHSSRETSSAEGSLENLLELSREIQEYHENEEFSNFERWNNYVNLAKSQCSSSGHSDDFQAVQDENTNLVHFKDEASGAKSPKGDFSPGQQMPLNPNFHLPLKSKSISAQIHNQLYGPLIHSAPAGENASSNSTMSIATTGSLRSDVTASPESYDMLYRSFEIAAMLDREDRQQGKTLQPSVPNIEMLSPKLQRLRQQSVARQSSPLPNFCSSGDKVFKQIEREEKPDNESRKVTFADLAQQRKRNELEKEEVRPVSLPVVTEIGQHWTELLSSTRTPDFVKQVRQQSEGLSPRRPQSLPIGLRHVKKPASRPFPKDVTPESFNSFRQEEPTDCITPELGVSRTFSAPEGLERNEEILIEEKCYDSADNLVHLTADGNRPVKVRQSQRHKVLEQDLLGEVVYVRNKPLKPIRQVDAEYNIRKGLPLPVPLQIPISQPILPAPEPLPPSFDFMDQPSFFGSEDAPEDIPLSAYEDMENSIEVDILQKKGLVGSINSAVDLILEHFGKSRQICSKMRLGDSYYTPDIGHIVLRYLCPALAAMLTDGMQPFIRNVIVGRVKNTVWHVVQAVTQLGPATKQMHEILSHVSNQGYLADPAMKFNAFVFGLLNAKCLEVWLQHVVSRTDILEKLYKPDSFLRLADGLLKPLLQELSVAIQPLCELPLKLDYKFEYNHIQDMKAREEGKNRLREEHEKKLPFSPFQLMKKVTRKTYERVSNHTHGRCSSEKKFFEEGGGDDSGKGWSVNWMKGLVSSGSNQTEKHVEKYPPIKSTLKTAETKFQDKHCPGTKSDLPSDKGKTARWSLFGSSISKALDNMIVEGGSSLIYGRLSHRDSFRLRRRGVTSETAIPAHFADELMGPRPDPAGASDSNASSPEWNLSCTQLMQSEAIKRQTKSS